jgi:hypothetical protein
VHAVFNVKEDARFNFAKLSGISADIKWSKKEDVLVMIWCQRELVHAMVMV